MVYKCILTEMINLLMYNKFLDTFFCSIDHIANRLQVYTVISCACKEEEAAETAFWKWKVQNSTKCNPLIPN